MKHILPFFFAAAALVSACGNVENSVFLKPDKSGSFETELFLENYLALQASLYKANEDSFLLASAQSLNANSAEINAIQGIRNFQSLADKNKKSLKLGFEFDNVEALNKAFATLLTSTDEKPLIKTENIFAMNGNNFTINLAGNNDLSNDELEMIKMSIASEEWTISVSTEGSIKSVKTKGALGVKSQKENKVVLVIYISELLSKKQENTAAIKLGN